MRSETQEEPGTAAEFAARVRTNQAKLASELKSHYDFIVCGSGSSGSVVARRLAETPGIRVLLLEAGGSDDVPSVIDPSQWFLNLGTERVWNFVGEPNPRTNGRSIPLTMGRVLGGGSSINLMFWARGHKDDWDFFASEAGDPAWNYESVLNIYRRIEDWHGVPDPTRRGTGGPAYVAPAADPNPIAPAMVEGARSLGIPSFESNNGHMMEEPAGASIGDLRVRDGKRQSVFRSYAFPYMDRPNLTVLTHARVTRLTFDDNRVNGVEISYAGKTRRIGARIEVVLSMGAISTPKLLMQSGIGEQAELRRLGIPVRQHLPGVGQNYQDHVRIGCVWAFREPLPPRNGSSEAVVFWKSDAEVSDAPDMWVCQAELPTGSVENTARYKPPAASWTMNGGLTRPKSRGRVRLTGPGADDPVQIETGMLSHPDDLKAAVTCVELCREIGNSAALRPFTSGEVMPGNLKGAELEEFVRDGADSYWHQTCTAKMGRDAMSVVDGRLNVYGIDNLRIADGSIMPRIVSGNTMASCVVIGERAAEILWTDHGL